MNQRQAAEASMTDFFKKHTLIAGTLLLTAAGFLSRILGFFYRIFLSRIIGSEGLGLYQMIYPIYGICFSLCAGSIQTAISRLTAAHPQHAKRILFAGIALSLSLSVLFGGAVSYFSDFLAGTVLLQPDCASLLPLFSLALPCASLHACINGWFYGKQKVQVPALAQLTEQSIRIFTVFLIADIFREQGTALTVRLAVFGLLAGEVGSTLFTLLIWLLFFSNGRSRKAKRAPSLLTLGISVFSLALPLMANRLVLNLLQSAEAVLIPSGLRQYGLTDSQAVSLYGVLTGMALPFIMFPSAIVNSLAVLLLPTVAMHQSSGNTERIAGNISAAFRYSLYMGILCIGIFTVFGERLGQQVFHSQEAGSFITILAWLCPFLYLATTTGSILNGLGKTRLTFLHNLSSLLLRLGFVYWGIPRFGIQALLWGMLAGEILLAFLHLSALSRTVGFSPNVWEAIVKPVFCLLTALAIYRLFPEQLPPFEKMHPFFLTAAQAGIVCLAYGLLLLLFHKTARD